MTGLEPATLGLEVPRAIQLRYTDCFESCLPIRGGPKDFSFFYFKRGVIAVHEPRLYLYRYFLYIGFNLKKNVTIITLNQTIYMHCTNLYTDYHFAYMIDKMDTCFYDIWGIFLPYVERTSYDNLHI